MALVRVAASGGDYTSLAAAEAGQQQDLTALAEPMHIECAAFNDAGGGVTFDGWTTSADYYIRVYAATGAKAGMPWRTSGAYMLDNGAAPASTIVVSEEFVRIEGIQVQVTAFGFSFTHNAISLGAGSTTSDVRVTGCHVRYIGNASNAGTARGIALTTFEQAFIVNCVVSGFDSTGGGTDRVGISEGTTNGTKRVYNCTIVNCLTGIARTNSASVIAKNNLVYGATTPYSGTFAAGSTNNASEDATAPGTSALPRRTFGFKDAKGGDYHLDRLDVGARGVGTDLSRDTDYAFSTDFDGATRTPGAWDVGAHQTAPQPHFRERSKYRTSISKDRHPWLWLRAYRPAGGGGAAAQSATVGAVPVVVHAPGVTVQKGAATRAVSAAPVVLHAPAVSVSVGVATRTISAAPIVAHAPTVATSAGAVSRTVGAAPLIVHAPTVTASAAAPGTQTATVSAAGVVAHAPAVATSVGAVQRAISAAPVVVHAPQVSTTTGTVTRVVASGVVVAHAPAVTVTIGAATRTVGAVGLVVHAPGVNTTTGTVTRAVAAAPLILHAPSVRGTNAPGQTRIVGAAAMVLHAPLPSAYILLYPTPPLYAPVDELRALAVVDDLRATVSVDDLATRVSLY